MVLNLWKNFSKRRNSTRTPGTPDSVLNVKLKEETSIERPSFILQGSDFEYNYAQAFGHYYFIDDIKSIANNLIQIDCIQDLLATYSNSIKASSLFVVRSQSNYDEMLPDNYVAIKNSESVYENVTSVANMFNRSGMYVISVLNDIGSGAGFTTYYLTTAAEIERLSHYCNQNLASDPSITTFVEWLQATALKTADAIIDCKWLPISATLLSGLSGLHSESMKIGKDIVYVNGSPVSGFRFTDTVIASKTYELTPQYAYSDFRLGSPYTKAFLFIPFYGVYQFNPLDFTTKVKVKLDLDLATGDITCYLYNGSDKLITTLNYNIGVTAPVGKVGNAASNAVSSSLGAVGGVVSSIAASTPAGTVAAGIGAAASAINAASSAVSISPSVRGALAGRSMSLNGLDLHMIIISTDTDDPDDLVPICGRPLMQKKTLNTLSGYVQTAEASVNMAGLGNDKDEINNLLDKGIYLE